VCFLLYLMAKHRRAATAHLHPVVPAAADRGGRGGRGRAAS
jgi:hypothetical protein